MTDFKVGDKVEVRTGINAPWEGAAVTITEANRRATGASFDVRVTRDDDGRDALYDNCELKLVEPETKFQVGDVVTFCMPDFAGWQGGEGIVRGLPSKERNYYKVELVVVPPANNAQRVGNKVNMPEECLEAAAPKTKFQVGDTVRVKGRNDRWDGTIATVTELRRVSPDYGQFYAVTMTEGVETGPADFFACDLEAYAPVEDAKGEAVEHPAHYGGDTTYEVIKVAEAWGFNENAYLFNALKYLARAGKKGDKVEDLEKLVFYVKREIALEEAK